MTNKQVYAGLLPCPFCGGEANGEGYIRYSRPLTDVQWEDGSEITEAFFVNCIKCGIDNARSGLVGGYQSKTQAIAQWNTRPEAAEAISSLLKRVGELRELLVKHAVHEEFDYPGDAPESCGFWCDICNQHVDDDNPAIGHAETCALNSDAPLSIGEEQ